MVSWLGAVQAQDYPGALWSLGLRLPGSTAAAIEQAVTEKTIVRTWSMRGTLHFVAAEDARWMLSLMTPRIIAGAALRSQRLELDSQTFSRSFQVLTDVLQGGEPLMRKDALDRLEKAGISTAGQRGYHILWRAAQEGLVCLGPIQGKQHTFVLLDDWLPPGRILSREESLAEIARRYFTSHGPATLQDFLWWTGLTAADGRAALEMASPGLVQETIDRRVYWTASALPEIPPPSSAAYLLPGFDEYLLGYKDRSAVLDPAHVSKIIPGGNGVFMPTLVIDGRVAGTWKRTLQKKTVPITFSPFAPLTDAEHLLAEAAAERYRDFLALPSPAA
ncbi:MAG: winged helix DNA-binding domain-containing protein [Armatimonadota bacterium]|nr:winged helix DNA-binding domain-containing protein [Armatimonadota bacterium]